MATKFKITEDEIISIETRNRFSLDFEGFGIRKLKKMLTELDNKDCENCKDCVECINCIDCVNCVKCIDCFRCSDCINCDRCRNCKVCENAKYKKDLRNIKKPRKRWF